MTSFFAIRQAKDYLGYNEEMAERHFKRVFQWGLEPERYPFRERAFLFHKLRNELCSVLVYKGYCYLFSFSGSCISMHPLPLWFGKPMPASRPIPLIVEKAII